MEIGEVMNDRKKRCLMLVKTQMQLLLALQIRKNRLKEQDADIVLIGKTFLNIYKNRELEEIFNSVYFIEDNKLSEIKSWIAFWNPDYWVKCYLQIDPSSYSDIFFWNPTWIYYYLYKYSAVNKQKYCWHLISDAIASYIAEAPEIHPRYGRAWNKWMNVLDRYIWKYGNLDNAEYDIYLCKPELAAYTSRHKFIRVPVIDKNDKNYVEKLNRVFGYQNQRIEQDVIFLDHAYDGDFDKREILSIIKRIGSTVGKDNFIIKKHPREKREIYKEVEDAANILESDVLWELYCLNGMADNKVIIGYYSSSFLLPNILFSNKIRTYAIFNLVQKKLQSSLMENYGKLLCVMEKNIDTFYNISSLEGLLEKVKETLSEKEK